MDGWLDGLCGLREWVGLRDRWSVGMRGSKGWLEGMGG